MYLDRHIRTEPACLQLRNKDGYTPFLIAANDGNMSALKFLVERGVNITNEREPTDDKTAAMIAAEEGHVQILNFLMENGATPGDVDRNGKVNILSVLV